jgi:hypothetical protein
VKHEADSNADGAERCAWNQRGVVDVDNQLLIGAPLS